MPDCCFFQSERTPLKPSLQHISTAAPPLAMPVQSEAKAETAALVCHSKHCCPASIHTYECRMPLYDIALQKSAQPNYWIVPKEVLVGAGIQGISSHCLANATDIWHM
eukprot:4878344-Amphidinium_carterae.2